MSSALAAFLALAAAMGIGRFAFTPVLPLMQENFGLSLADGGLLAAANYAGYLFGAIVLTLRPARPTAVARAGLVAVAAATAAMAVAPDFMSWSALRFAAGVASAGVFVGVASLTVVASSYAGVGAGIAVTGLLAMAVGRTGGSAAGLWTLLGALAGVLAVLAWRPIGTAPPPRPPSPVSPAAATPPTGTDTATSLRLVACYGATGLGYILPATFLPATARDLVPDPAVFGWAWPIFGAAAAVSTVAATPVLRRHGPLRVWALAQAVMAAGVLAPVLLRGLPGLAVAAAAVGGTFMVITLAAMQAAREIAPGVSRLVPAMTMSFATGQLIGPLLVRGDDLTVPSLLAATVLLAGAAGLPLTSRTKGRRHVRTVEGSPAPRASRADGRRATRGRR